MVLSSVSIVNLLQVLVEFNFLETVADTPLSPGLFPRESAVTAVSLRDETLFW